MSAQIASTTQSEHVVPRVAEAASRVSRTYPGFLASVGLVALICGGAPALAATAPNLLSESTYGVVSSSYTGNIAATTINGGDVCYTGLAGFAPVINGGVVVGPPCPPVTGTDQLASLFTLNNQPCTPLGVGPLEGISIGGGPAGHFPPGCYSRAGALDITANGIVTLDGAGVYIFKSTGGAVTTGANSSFILEGGACESDVYWAPVGATTLGATSAFVGNILDAAGITIGLNANLTGRALAFGGTVTTAAATITAPSCAPFMGSRAAIPTLSEWAIGMLAALLAIVGFAAMRRQAR